MENDFYEGLIKHQEETYQQVINQYSKLLWAVAATVLINHHAADIEEIVSDVFIRLWQDPKKYDPEKGSLKTYLALMTKSMAINKVKKNNRNPFRLVDEKEAHQEKIEQEQNWQILYSAIQQLEEPAKEIIIRRFFYEEKPKIIQQNMNISAKEIDNYLYRGKKKLRKILGDKNYLKEVENYGR